MGNFTEDLKKGKDYEKIVMDILNAQGFNLVPNPNEKGMDLIIAERGIEVKCDEKAQYTGNFYIEFESNGKPSGIFKEEDISLKYWAHTNGKELFLLNGKFLQRYVANKIDECMANKSLTSKGTKLITNGGNGGRTKGIVLPVDEIRKISTMIFDIEKT